MANYIKILHDNFTEICLNDEARCFYLPIVKGNVVSTFIGMHYTVSDEIALNNNHLADATEEHEANWTKYQEYRTNVKSALSEIWEDVEKLNKEWEDAQPKPEPILTPDESSKE